MQTGKAMEPIQSGALLKAIHPISPEDANRKGVGANPVGRTT